MDDFDIVAGVWRFKKRDSKLKMYRQGMESNINIEKDGHLLAALGEIQRLNEIIRKARAYEIDRAAYQLGKI